MMDIDEQAKKNMCFSKKVYYTEKHANKVAFSIGQRRNLKLRVYQCPICGFFHLTHIESIYV